MIDSAMQKGQTSDSQPSVFRIDERTMAIPSAAVGLSSHLNHRLYHLTRHRCLGWKCLFIDDALGDQNSLDLHPML